MTSQQCEATWRSLGRSECCLQGYCAGRGRTQRSQGYFSGGHVGGVAFRGRDMGPDPPDGAGPEQIPAQGIAMSHQEAAEVEGGGEIVISSADISNGGVRLWIDWGLHHKKTEYGRAIYCDAADAGPLWTVYSEAGNLGVSVVVGTGETWSRGGEVERSGGVGRRGGEMWRGSGAGRDAGSGLNAGSTTVVN